MSQSDRDYSEKRDYIRMRLETQVTLHHAGHVIEALCRDLSSTGMQIQARCSVQEGDKVKVLIPSGHDELKGLEAEAEVVRVTDLEDGQQILGLAVISMN
ncbi:PilZ domain-containing protein [Phytopseudomonas dryadis]|uniref:PilZ domain-containing protein n=1 Tax=Phytopseudomonas dryadis TaxID=2487520 RepID=A0A4Q9QUC7_9GAMM|nr:MULTISPECIES: PilZ domain-containing protein [Pseudomonas]TBU85675.1 PilZ domain-containing protein [Pseudomonas dryadis]TBV09287.1 PilZ domain-containing protein [Pseudomonas dryadis]TBV18674.1 PilZ domain-containing protein [Pseudomonas sp. FRB 230]